MVLYTDGLIEAKKETDEMYGVDRLKTVVEKSITVSPKLAIQTILEDQKVFCGVNNSPDDDITLLVVDF